MNLLTKERSGIQRLNTYDARLVVEPLDVILVSSGDPSSLFFK